MLDESLMNHKSKSGNPDVQISKTPKKRKSTTSKNIQHNPVNDDKYIPTYRSGAYAILVALYKKSLDSDYEGFMLKKDLIKEAQPHCDNSFTKAEVGSFYTSWNSMKTLISKKLIEKHGNPAKFSLTPEGIILGCKLYNRTESMDNSVNTSGEIFSKPTTSCTECVVLSDSDDEEIDKMNCIVSEQVPPISNELKEICGVFSGVDNINKNKKEKHMAESKGEKLGAKSTAVKEKKSTKDKNKVSEVLEHEDFIMSPYSFEILLFVDTQETGGKQIDPKSNAISSELERLDIKYEVRNLKVGDYCWICRHKISGKELIAPYIVERKRMDDLASSIKDGRFHEQKFRIKQCGLKNMIYMIESYGTKDQHVGLPLSSCNQAIVNTLIQDGFVVKIVDGVRGLAEYLSCMTNLIKKHYEEKTIVSCPKENISDISITDDLVPLMFFLDFNKHSSKTKTFTVKEMFIRQLLQIKGLSVEKALAIVQEYPTLKILKDMISENEKKSVNILSNIKYGKLGKKIGPVLGETLYMLYTKISF